MDLKRDYRDIVGGALMLAFGAFVVIYTRANYDLGTFRKMGTGMFPFLLGIALIGFGTLVMIPAFFRPGKRPHIRVWSPIFVLSSIAAFALIITPFGLIPAICAVTVISSMAELKVRPLSLLLLCIGLSLMAWLVFRIGLGVPLAMFNAPF